ncbi:Ribose-phosphate pyrophosphokinase 2, chloroplastic [Capsicum annuum]|uniref:ribose-phosphate diphosphokinase n=1 Tax=Capsicum annuum TaxID=4072 RepID=A0A2G3AFB5_CAPAN|nr:Ribose-phosphate pyrophosphokinase 2, chloroplastic [Capsicum annuum]
MFPYRSSFNHFRGQKRFHGRLLCSMILLSKHLFKKFKHIISSSHGLMLMLQHIFHRGKNVASCHLVSLNPLIVGFNLITSFDCKTLFNELPSFFLSSVKKSANQVTHCLDRASASVSGSMEWRAKKIAMGGIDYVDFSYPAPPVGIEATPRKDDDEFELRKSTEEEVLVALTDESVTITGICGMKCEISEPVNGKPSVPIINDGTLSKFLQARRLQNAVGRNNNRLKIFTGTANPSLSQEIAWYMGFELGKVNIKRFADGEIYVQLQESVRGCDVYLIQSTCPPANENLMELLVMIDACRRASAKTITAVIPYFGYARADRKASRESIGAKLVANLITEAGADRVLACDLHSGQSMGYFDIPVDHVYCQPVVLDYLASKKISSDDLVVVSPDVGGVARARAFAKKLSDAPLAIVDKRRQGHNIAEVMNLIGDVKGKVAVMVDDMIDTAGTIAKGAALLHQEGAREVYACCTHAVFSPPAIERLSSGLFQEVIVTNTIPAMEKNYFPQLTVLSVANLLGETIWRVHDDCSVSSIFHTLASHPYFTRSKAKLVMASREIENSLIDPDQDHREESSEHNDEVVRLRQQLIDLHRAWASGMPPPPLSEGLGNISNCPPLSQAQFSAPTESPEHAPGFTPRHYYPGSSGVPLVAPQSRPAA